MKSTKLLRFLKVLATNKPKGDALIFINSSSKPRRGNARRHTSISLKGMLVPAQISTTQRNRMSLNSNPEKRMTQNSKPEKQNNLRSKLQKMGAYCICTISYYHIISYTSVADFQSISCLMAWFRVLIF